MKLAALTALAATLMTGSLAAAQPGSRGRAPDRRDFQRDSHRDSRRDDHRGDHWRGRGYHGHYDHRPPVIIVRPPVRRYYYAPRPYFYWPRPHFHSGLFFNLHID